MDDKELIPREVLLKYFQGLTNRIFKCIPTLEGRDISGRVVYLPEIAKENYKKYLSKLLVEIYGNSSLFFVDEKSVQILGILRGCLIECDPEEYKKIRSSVFDAMTLVEKIVSILKEGEESGI